MSSSIQSFAYSYRLFKKSLVENYKILKISYLPYVLSDVDQIFTVLFEIFYSFFWINVYMYLDRSSPLTSNFSIFRPGSLRHLPEGLPSTAPGAAGQADVPRRVGSGQRSRQRSQRCWRRHQVGTGEALRPHEQYRCQFAAESHKVSSWKVVQILILLCSDFQRGVQQARAPSKFWSVMFFISFFVIRMSKIYGQNTMNEHYIKLKPQP